MRNSEGHSVPKGRSIIERIEAQLDKRRKKLEQLREKEGVLLTAAMEPQAIEQGRMEGMAAALAILRSSSLGHEIERCHERLGIE